MSKHFSQQTRERMSESAKLRCTQEWRNKKSKQYSTPIDIGKLRELYESGLTQSECAEALGVTQKVVWRAMKNNGIKARIAAKRHQEGHANSYWKGGHTKHSGGYMCERVPNHPRASAYGNYVFSHILVMERYLGRYLQWFGADDSRTEVVHHINGVKTDNRIENLMLMSVAEHVRLHDRQRRMGVTL